VISFRYHLVSLAAVLFALAAGVLLGAGPLDNSLGTGDSNDVQQAKIDALNTQVAALNQRVSYDDAAATALAPAVLPARLAGKTVVLVTMPDTDRAQVQELTGALQTAGATVTGQVDVQPAWVDPDQATVLGTLATQLAPKDLTLPSGGPYVQAGATLSTALVTDRPTHSDTPDDTSQAILTGFVEGGFITVQGEPGTHAQLALVISPAPTPGDTDAQAAASEALLPLVAALDSGMGAVLGGAEGSADVGGLVAALRNSGPVRRSVSSVDVADVPSGVIASVLALAQQSTGTAGQYGLGPGAESAMPPSARGRG
jgi:Copper transport outer membrane protein, MctB